MSVEIRSRTQNVENMCALRNNRWNLRKECKSGAEVEKKNLIPHRPTTIHSDLDLTLTRYRNACTSPIYICVGTDLEEYTHTSCQVLSHKQANHTQTLTTSLPPYCIPLSHTLVATRMSPNRKIQVVCRSERGSIDRWKDGINTEILCPKRKTLTLGWTLTEGREYLRQWTS